MGWGWGIGGVNTAIWSQLCNMSSVAFSLTALDSGLFVLVSYKWDADKTEELSLPPPFSLPPPHTHTPITSRSHHVVTPSVPWWGTTDAEIKAPLLSESHELSKIPLVYAWSRSEYCFNNNYNNEILIKYLVYTRARRAVQKRKKKG